MSCRLSSALNISQILSILISVAPVSVVHQTVGVSGIASALGQLQIIGVLTAQVLVVHLDTIGESGVATVGSFLSVTQLSKDRVSFFSDSCIAACSSVS